MNETMATIDQRIAFIKASIDKKRLGESSAIELNFLLTLDIRELLTKQNDLLEKIASKETKQPIITVPIVPAPAPDKKSWLKKIFNK